MNIALLTNKTFLLRKNKTGQWENFIDITKYPQIGGEVDRIEVTRLHDTKKRYIPGLADSVAFIFEANYTKNAFAKVQALALTEEMSTFSLCFGDKLGTDGCWEWQGRVSCYVGEGEPNGIRKFFFAISDEGELPIEEVEALTPDDIFAGSAILGVAILSKMILGYENLLGKLEAPKIELVVDSLDKLDTPVISLVIEELEQLNTPVIELIQDKLDTPVIELLEE